MSRLTFREAADICGMPVEILDNPKRVAPPDRLTENGYADDPDFQEREERRHEFEADRDRVNNELWERDDDATD